MEQGTTKISGILLAQIESVAKEMTARSENERRFDVTDTSVKLWLVKAGTPEAHKREVDKGSVMSGLISIEGQDFFVSRR